MNEVYDRVVAWNSARYPREYSQKLTQQLLAEEVEELFLATEEVDALDALCDIAFVAMGAMWKAGITEEESEIGLVSAHKFVGYCTDILPINTAHLYSTFVLATNKEDIAFTGHAILHLCLHHMKTCLGLDREQQRKALLIVCDSNDSKTVAKTEPNIKANIDKGPNFIKPEPRLQELLNDRYK